MGEVWESEGRDGSQGDRDIRVKPGEQDDALHKRTQPLSTVETESWSDGDKAAVSI